MKFLEKIITISYLTAGIIFFIPSQIEEPKKIYYGQNNYLITDGKGETTFLRYSKD